MFAGWIGGRSVGSECSLDRSLGEMGFIVDWRSSSSVIVCGKELGGLVAPVPVDSSSDIGSVVVVTASTSSSGSMRVDGRAEGTLG